MATPTMNLPLPVPAEAPNGQRRRAERAAYVPPSRRAPAQDSSAKSVPHKPVAEPTTSAATPASPAPSTSLRDQGRSPRRTHQGKGPSPARATPQRSPRKARNTESFAPDYCKPDLRVVVGPHRPTYGRTVGVHDVIMVPEMFCAEDDLSLYESLLAELKATGSTDLFVSWHGDSHVIADDKKMKGKWKELSPSFQKVGGSAVDFDLCCSVMIHSQLTHVPRTQVIKQMEEYFNMDIKATRFNWYRDSSEWKPYHHDRAAFTPNCPQNSTVAASFGAERDIAFLHATKGTTIRIPQPNGSMYAFNRDANVEWKHGVMAVPPALQHTEGRISIIAWGWIDMEDWQTEMKLENQVISTPSKRKSDPKQRQRRARPAAEATEPLGGVSAGSP
ncbi:uncharacterized protein MONBRDRAFT_29584 [Monosiga brevicollis MX1]|uniref:Fe2OG dioxygenase domain-containing protein n=1 Tax=Monosiga brevicollis TaxID=81824 RepID=A9VBI7_MONBE|nr:uncharacterized protein MONBRDRAFT_29584 [Monosiga brevicollis MX1]EDQ85105.1 predicted protein [Monosiga brevicollis MX1]|eukprot:XP_001750109.1 hypothetical protein [Monosiga brevicollis MX1]